MANFTERIFLAVIYKFYQLATQKFGRRMLLGSKLGKITGHRSFTGNKVGERERDKWHGIKK